MCPTVAEVYRKLQDRMMRFGFISVGAHEYLWAVRTGKPLVLTHDNVRFQNSLQVANAERFVFSKEERFDDAMRMVDADSAFTRGPRVVVS